MNTKTSPLAVLDAKYWESQAALALEYAKSRPASDTKGFCAALRDAAEFERRAALAAFSEVA